MIDARCFYQIVSDDFGLFLVREEGGRREIAAPIQWVEHKPGLRLTEPTLDLMDREAQRLIDSLWSAGLRPTLGRQSEGTTAAQGRHLEDMRALVFAKAGVEKPA